MTNLSLYEITDEMLALDELLEMQKGELTDDYELLEEKVFSLLVNKVDSCVSWVEREKDLIELADNKIKILKEFIAAKKNKLANFDNYVKVCLERMDKKELNGKLNQIKIRKPSQVLVIDDESQVPVEFTTVETLVKIKKAELKKAVKCGEITIPAIRLEDGKTSLIYGLIRNTKTKEVSND